MKCWDEHFWWIFFVLVDYCTFPCQDWVSGHLDLRTDVAIYVIFKAVMDAQFYVNSFSLDRWGLRWIILHGYDLAFYIVLWLLLLLNWFLWHVLTCGIMIWRSYLYGLGCILYYVLMSLFRLGSSWSILIGFTLLRENRGSHSHHCFGLLSPPIHYLPVLF